MTMRKFFAASLLLAAIFCGPARAQQPPHSPILNEGTPALINCHRQPYVSLLAEPEQIFPLKLVATVRCGEEVVIVSDPEAYYLKVRTADGKVGYVSYLDLTLLPDAPPKPADPAPAPAAPANSRPSGPPPAAAPPNPGPAAAPADSPRPRVYVSDSKSWAATGGFNPASAASSGRLYAGYDPEQADVYQSFTTDCPAVQLTAEVELADYALLFDHADSDKGSGPLSGLIKPNKMTLVARNGETLFSKSTYSSSGPAVKKACAAIARRTAPNAANK